MRKLLTAGVIAASFNLAPVAAQAQVDARQIPVADYAVFVDPPTGYAFVKLPAGWKFVGKVDAADVSTLPAHVMTALVKPDTQLASR